MINVGGVKGVFLFVFLLSIMLSYAPASADVVVPSTNTYGYGNLQYYVDESSAYSSILLDGGVYDVGVIEVDKPLSIECAGSTILGSFLVKASNVSIRDCIINASGLSGLSANGVFMYGGFMENETVVNNTIYTSERCVWLIRVNNSVIRNNSCLRGKFGIDASGGSSGNSINGNIINLGVGGWIGLNLRDNSIDNVVEENSITNTLGTFNNPSCIYSPVDCGGAINGIDLSVYNATGNTFTRNTFRSNINGSIVNVDDGDTGLASAAIHYDLVVANSNITFNENDYDDGKTAIINSLITFTSPKQGPFSFSLEGGWNLVSIPVA